MNYINKKKDNYIKIKNDQNNYELIAEDITVYYKDRQGKRKHLKLNELIKLHRPLQPF